MLAKQIEAMVGLSPGKGEGYNLVEVDEFALPGEDLVRVSSHATRAEAESAKREQEQQHPGVTFYVYGPPEDP